MQPLPSTLERLVHRCSLRDAIKQVEGELGESRSRAWALLQRALAEGAVHSFEVRGEKNEAISAMRWWGYRQFGAAPARFFDGFPDLGFIELELISFQTWLRSPLLDRRRVSRSPAPKRRPGKKRVTAEKIEALLREFPGATDDAIKAALSERFGVEADRSYVNKVRNRKH